MSRWHDVFKEHEIHSKIENIQKILTDDAFKETDADAEQEIARFNKVFNILKATLPSIDQELISNSSLNNILGQLNTVEQQLKSFQSNSSINHVQNANNHFDKVLEFLSQIVRLGPGDNIEEIVSVNSLINRGEQFLVTLDERRKELQHQIAGLKTSSTHLESRLAELAGQVEVKVAELNKLSTNWTNQFNESQNEKQIMFRDSLTSIEGNATSDTDKIISELKAEVAEHQENYQLEIKNLIDDAKVRHSNIRELHGLVSDDSITGGHKQIADSEVSSADRWRRFSVFFAILSACWLIYVFSQAGEISWKVSFGGLPITLILISIAGYMGHQSSLHRHQANRQRQFALEMMAIDPYLENLGDEMRGKIKAELSSKYFGDFTDLHRQKSSKDTVVLPNSIPDWIFKIFEMRHN